MVETFNEILIVGEVITDKDIVVYLLASLPESFNILATALESNPSMEIVIDRLMHEEKKLENCGVPKSVGDRALTAKKGWRKVYVTGLAKLDLSII